MTIIFDCVLVAAAVNVAVVDVIGIKVEVIIIV